MQCLVTQVAQFDMPADARWVAADHDGATYAFTDKPVCFDGKRWMSNGERSWYLGDIGMTGINCKSALMEIVRVSALIHEDI